MPPPALPSARARQPRGLSLLFFTELWERFSYYGMRALLVYYLVQGLGWHDDQATWLYGLYTGSVYLTPIVGGLVTDRVLGTERAIGVGAAMMAAGHFALALPSLGAFYGGLLLLSLGCGLFKPNVSNLLGQLYAPGDPRRAAGFSWFYMGINVGALLAPLVCGSLGERYGWHYGFAAAGAGMLVSWGLFVGLWPRLRGELVEPGGAAESADELAPANRLASGGARMVKAAAEAAAPGAGEASRASARERWLLLGVLGGVGNLVFWAAFEQAGSSVALFVARGGDLHLPGGGELPASWYQAFNPIAIVLLAPLVASVWRRLAARSREPAAPLKFVFGLCLLAASFAWLAALGHVADLGHKVPLLWFAGPSVLATLGELCISPVGLALVSEVAPRQARSLTLGLWFASMALGNVAAGVLAGHASELGHARFFLEPALLCAGTALVLAPIVPRLTRSYRALTTR